MSEIKITPLRDDLSFGVRINGVTRANSLDPKVRDQVNAAFRQHGMIVFEQVESSDAMQVALSEIFGPLKEHPVKSVARVDANSLPGVVAINALAGEGGVVDLGGTRLSHWLPWHFDHCYNDELNYAGVLRATEIVDQGGLTGFADGIALYNAFPKDLLARIEGQNVLYTLNVQYDRMKFGLPPQFSVIQRKPSPPGFEEQALAMPRAIHPAVWTRDSGENVLHVSPWMADGIAGREDAEGDALLAEVCQTINALSASCSYHHKWLPTDMVIWDNTRMLHSVSGNSPHADRRMQRTTIKGDYGLGRFEGDASGDRILSETTV